MRYVLTLSALVLGLALAACGNDNDPNPGDPNPGDPNPGDPNPGDPNPGDALTQTFAVSECGGFEATGESKEPTFGQGDKDYCAAEVLDLTYDADAKALTLVNQRVLLNCCGEHEIKVSLEQDGTYVITETDAPDEDGGRCRCMCVFDFEVTVKPIAQGPIQVKLIREVTDSDEGPQQVFAGTIDLGSDSGAEVVDATDVGPWCDSSTEPEPQPVSHAPEVSECGGFAGEPDSDALDYCDAEVLDWTYDAAAQQLTITDKRVLLNCCGEHDITVTKDSDGTYSITETDAPEADGGRCDCMCVFDFSTTIDGVTGDEVAVRLTRQVNEDGGTASATMLFDGALDLTAGSGSEILDQTDAAPWCQP